MKTPLPILLSLLLLSLACGGKQKVDEAPPPPPPAPAEPSAAAAEEEGPRKAPWAKSGIEDWTTPPKARAESPFRPPAPTTFTLPSGLQVVVQPRHTLPLVSIELIARGAGSAADPKKQPGLAAFTADLLDEGAGKRSAMQIAQEVERLGATLHTGVTADHGWISMQTLARTFDASFDLFTSILTRPSFSPAEIKRVQGETVDNLKTRQDRSREVASLVFEQTLYGADTPYGHPAEGFVASVKGFSAPAVKKFHQQAWRPENMVLVISGDVDIVALRQNVQKRLGRFKGKGKKVKLKAPAAAPAKKAARLTLVDRPDAPQSELRAGLVGMSRSDPRYASFEVLTTLLGGGFTSRLNNRLREQLGYTYGIRAMQVDRSGRGPFLIASALHTPKTADAVQEILRMVGELATTPVPADELEKAKLNLIRALPTRFETNGEVAGTLGALAAHGLPLTWYDDYEKQIRAVDAAALQKLAGQLVPEGQLLFTIVGDTKVIEADLVKILGPAKKTDPEGKALK
ncbi:MAG: pitrilysin family protein [Deltaproteobacteria bacterium]|nr:pitrilysin family protein [Deltaproteobacteria bacterium]